MTYREILKLYKSGQLDEEAKKEVEKDIEKQDAISEYLYDNQEIPEIGELAGDLSENHESEKNDEFLSLVQRTIRKAFIKMGLVVGTVILAVVLGSIFILPNMVSLFYYNPNKTVGVEKESGIETKKMSLDLSVYSELFLPGKYRNEVRAEPNGFGEYDIVIPQVMGYNQRFNSVSGKLKRNKLTLYDANLTKLPVSNVFIPPKEVKCWNTCIYDENGEFIGPVGIKKEAFDAINDLNENEYYITYVSLNEIMDYRDFVKLAGDEWFGFSQLWCAVYAETEGGNIAENIGFIPKNSGICMDWDREKYPYLSGLDNENIKNFDAKDENLMKEHFISMLKYMRDNIEFLEIVDHMHNYDKELFDKIIENVEKNGLKIYGFAGIAKKDDIQKLTENDSVSYIYTIPLN